MLCSARPAWADQLVTGTRNYPNGSIVGFERGIVLYQPRGPGGSEVRAAVEDVTQLVVDRGGAFDDFNQAERFFADKQPQRAVIRYRRFFRLADGFWSDLTTARLALACDAANQLDEATGYVLRLLRRGEEAVQTAIHVMPDALPQTFDKRAVRAVHDIDAALEKDPDDSMRAVLELLRYDILRATGHGDVAKAAARVAELAIPPRAYLSRTCGIQLRALASVIQDHATGAVVPGLNRVIENCPENALAEALLLKGRVLLSRASTREEIIRAAWPFLRIPIHFPDDPLAPDGLYGAALALERLERPNKALALLEECARHPRISPETRRRVDVARERLRTAPSGAHEPTSAKHERGQ